MLPQSQIQRTLGGAASVDRIVDILAADEFTSRGAFGRQICEEFGFATPNTIAGSPVLSARSLMA